MTEVVAEEYGLTEEYVLSKHYLWIRRKYRRIERRRYQKRQSDQGDMFNALLAALSYAFAQDPNYTRYLLEDFEDLLKPKEANTPERVKHDQRQFVKGAWWLPKEKQEELDRLDD